MTGVSSEGSLNFNGNKDKRNSKSKKKNSIKKKKVSIKKKKKDENGDPAKGEEDQEEIKEEVYNSDDSQNDDQNTQDDEFRLNAKDIILKPFQLKEEEAS